MADDIERAECRTCGQQVLGERDASGRFRCFHCLETDRAPQGVQDRLFEPVAAPMAGQTHLASLLRHHVTGAIERGEAEPIVEQRP